MLATWAEPSEFLEKRPKAPEVIQQNLFLRVCDLLRKPNHFLIEDRVRFRVCCVLFHHLFKWCEDQVRTAYNTTHELAPLKKNVIFILAQVIDRWNILPCGEAVTETEIRTWVGKGERYQRLLVDLGGPGSLFLLPNEGEGEYFWLERVPIDRNDRRNALIQSLLNRGIEQLSSSTNANRIAHSILCCNLGYLRLQAYIDLFLPIRAQESRGPLGKQSDQELKIFTFAPSLSDQCLVPSTPISHQANIPLARPHGPHCDHEPQRKRVRLKDNRRLPFNRRTQEEDLTLHTEASSQAYGPLIEPSLDTGYSSSSIFPNLPRNTNAIYHDRYDPGHEVRMSCAGTKRVSISELTCTPYNPQLTGESKTWNKSIIDKSMPRPLDSTFDNHCQPSDSKARKLKEASLPNLVKGWQAGRPRKIEKNGPSDQLRNTVTQPDGRQSLSTSKSGGKRMVAIPSHMPHCAPNLVAYHGSGSIPATNSLPAMHPAPPTSLTGFSINSLHSSPIPQPHRALDPVTFTDFPNVVGASDIEWQTLDPVVFIDFSVLTGTPEVYCILDPVTFTDFLDAVRASDTEWQTLDPAVFVNFSVLTRILEVYCTLDPVTFTDFPDAVGASDTEWQTLDPAVFADFSVLTGTPEVYRTLDPVTFADFPDAVGASDTEWQTLDPAVFADFSVLTGTPEVYCTLDLVIFADFPNMVRVSDIEWQTLDLVVFIDFSILTRTLEVYCILDLVIFTDFPDTIRASDTEWQTLDPAVFTDFSVLTGTPEVYGILDPVTFADFPDMAATAEAQHSHFGPSGVCRFP